MTTRLLSVEGMRRADAAAEAAGVPVQTLMENAGAAVAVRAAALAGGRGRILVLCGPGNNGGDGYVAARRLADEGHEVEVRALAPATGAAVPAAAAWTGPIASAVPLADSGAFDVVVDALFGGGLSRPLEGDARALVETLNDAGRRVLAVDVPSGLDGDTGQVRGAAVQATETIAFAALKPGHLLQPGRARCGRLHVAEIGLPADALRAGLETGPATHRNAPGLWLSTFPRPAAGGHKYGRGHVLALSGPAYRTGAARLAARGALRIGAGLVTMASPKSALAENAAHLTAIMLRPCEDADDLDDLLADDRLNVVLAGPGLGTGAPTRALVEVAAATGRRLVLDADALTSFDGQAEALADHLRDGAAQAVLTPHDGEFARLFAVGEGPSEGRDKLARSRAAAARIGAVIVLKGADTVVAAPDGRAAINDHGTPYLGTAGSGDVLAGLIAGLLAQGMMPFEAAAAAVWLHGDAACRYGPGLIAEDLPDLMPVCLRDLLTVLG